jgi:hypothetical protein
MDGRLVLDHVFQLLENLLPARFLHVPKYCLSRLLELLLYARDKRIQLIQIK